MLIAPDCFTLLTEQPEKEEKQMRKTISKLVNLFRSKDNLIFVKTYEENAFICEVCNAIRQINNSEGGFKIPGDVYVYSRTRGLSKVDIMSPVDYNPETIIKSVKNHMEARH